jgi:hypothetical protein
MEPDPNASAQQQQAREQAREQARAAARAAAIQSCHIECRKLLHKILHLQNELFRLQINQNPNDVERRQIKDLIHQIVRLKLIMNLFHFCILCIKKPKRFDTHIFTF